jgi:DNA-binding NtrC family response regulator
VQVVLDAFRAGSYEFLEKPLSRDTLLELAERSVALREMGEKRRKLAEALENERTKVLELRQQLVPEDPFVRMLGPSSGFQGFLDTVREVARTDSTVLITGESGTGKGMVSRLIHEASARNEGPFVEANCVVYSEGLLHSELFGHERGAFTGADRTKRGRFELAQGGTLFLDEIGEIAASTQLLLLRVLQDRTFERVGGEETLEADVRLIAATNRDLQKALDQGSFRSDLFYRLNVIPVHVPPLREHPDDIPVLVHRFLERAASQTGKQIGGVSEPALEAFCRYSWPGNVRELENAIERLVVLNRSGTIELQDLPTSITQGASATDSHRVPGTLQEMERLRIIDALRETNGNKKRAARRLGIHRSTLYAKMRRYGLMEAPADEDPSREERHDVSEDATLVTTS